MDDAYAIGRAFGTMVSRNLGKTVTVGYDGRISSPEVESSLTQGLVDSGIAANPYQFGADANGVFCLERY